MMTWIRKHYHRFMIRPIITQTITRAGLALVIALLWDRYLNPGGLRGLDLPLGVFGLILLAFAWFSYLGTDGVEGPMGIVRKRRKGQKKKTTRFAGGDMADYLDEEVVPFSELEEEDKKYCRLAANGIAGLALVLASLLFFAFSR